MEKGLNKEVFIVGLASFLRKSRDNYTIDFVQLLLENKFDIDYIVSLIKELCDGGYMQAKLFSSKVANRDKKNMVAYQNAVITDKGEQFIFDLLAKYEG